MYTIGWEAKGINSKSFTYTVRSFCLEADERRLGVRAYEKNMQCKRNYILKVKVIFHVCSPYQRELYLVQLPMLLSVWSIYLAI